MPWREMGPTVMEEAPRRRGDPGAVSKVRFCRVDRRLPPGEPVITQEAAQMRMRTHSSLAGMAVNATLQRDNLVTPKRACRINTCCLL